QHLLDQVDAAARTIELIAEQDIGRAGRGAETAVDAGAQDLVGFRDVGVGELREREFGLHAVVPRVSRPRLRMDFGSKLARTRSLRAATPEACGWNTSIARLTSSPARISVACPPNASARWRTAGACASAFGGNAAQIRPPPQS